MKQPLFSPQRCCRQVVLLLGSLLLFAQCQKEDPNRNAPGWYPTPADYVYDMEDSAGNKESATQLSTFFQEADPNAFLFIENSPDPNAPDERYYFDLGQRRFTRTPEGLYGQASSNCSVGLLSEQFLFLAVPAVPKAGAAFPLYGCGHKGNGQYTVLQTDTIITVPAGTFHTFRLRHENGDQSWWNLEKGIVLFQTAYLDYNSQPTGKILLRLRKIVQR